MRTWTDVLNIGGVPLYKPNQGLRDSTAYKNGADGDVGLTEAF